MAQFSTTVRNWDQANEFLGLKPERPIGHNTRIIRRDDGVIYVKYHESAVVKYFPVGMVDGGAATILDSCGWKTITTKERLNAFCPAGFNIWQERGVWTLSRRGERPETWTFADGITIMQNGDVFNAGPANEKERIKKLVKRINEYAHTYAQALVEGQIPAPSSGDCWGCCMVAEDGTAPLGGPDHLLTHLDESYLVPSLLLRAIEAQPNHICRLSKGAIGSLWSLNGQTPADVHQFEKDILLRDIPRLISLYFKHALNLAA